MKKIITVIAEPNFGKSTIIASLTGFLLTSQHGWVEDHMNGEKVYVFCSSPQENPQIDATLIDEIRRSIETDPLARGIVLALQPKRCRDHSKRMENCIMPFVANPLWDISNFAVSPGYMNQIGSPAQIVSILNGIGILTPPTLLDGRRFAFINAQTIQTVSHIMF